MPSDHEREVRIRLKLEADTASAQAATKGFREGLNVTARATENLKTNWKEIIGQAKAMNLSLEGVRKNLTAAEKVQFDLALATKETSGAIKTSTATMEDYRAATLRSRIASERMGIQFSRMGRAGLQALRGIMFFAASSDDDMQKMLRSLVKIQAGFDVLSGSLRMVANLSRMWRAYTASVEAAAVAHATLAAVQASSGAGGVGAGVASGVGTAVGTGVGAGAGSAASHYLRTYGRDATIAGTTAVTTGLAAKYFPTMGRWAKGGWGLAKAGASRAAPFTIPVAAGAAAAGGTVWSWKSAWEAGGEAAKYGIGGGATPGSYTERVGGSYLNPFSWLIAGDRQVGRWRSENRTARMEERLARYGGPAGIEEMLRKQGAVGTSALGATRRFGRERGRAEWGLRERDLGAIKARRQRLTGELSEAGTFWDERSGGMSPDEQREKVSELINRRNELIGVIKQEADASVRASQQKIALHDQEIDKLRQTAKAYEQTGRKKTEEFVLMSPLDQARLTRDIEATRAGTATRMQLRRVRGAGLSDMPGLNYQENIRGLERENRYLQRAGIKPSYERAAADVNIKINDKRDIVVTLKQDTTGLQKAAEDAIKPHLKKIEETQKKMVEDVAKAVSAAIERQAKEAAANVKGSS